MPMHCRVCDVRAVSSACLRPAREALCVVVCLFLNAAITNTHKQACRHRENSTRIELVAVAGGPVCIWERGACAGEGEGASATANTRPKKEEKK